MRRKEIRCFKIYDRIGNNIHNHEIIIPLRGGRSNNTLVTCKKCGELFVIDWENPATENLSIQEIAGFSECPTCKSLLRNEIADYPDTIKISEGVFGSFHGSIVNYSDDQTEVIEFYELRPST